MRRTFGFLVIGGIAAIAFAQSNGRDLLDAFAKKLNDAQSVSSTYTIQIIGSAPESYSVTLKKPNLVKIDTPDELIVADGKTITTLDKSDNTYTKQPQSEDAMNALFTNDELKLFGGFFTQAAYKAAAVKGLGAKNRKGQTVQAVQANVDDAGKKTITYFVGADGLARAAQFDLNDPSGKVTYIVDSKTFEIDGNVSTDAFAFNAPANAREISLDDLNATKWHTNLREAMALASKTNKKIFVDFYATWCGPCKKLDAEVLSTPAFKALSNKLVFVRIDVDIQKDVAQAYKIEAMPTQMVLDAKGTVLSTKVGYANPRDFFGWLNPAL